MAARGEQSAAAEVATIFDSRLVTQKSAYSRPKSAGWRVCHLDVSGIDAKESLIVSLCRDGAKGN